MYTLYANCLVKPCQVLLEISSSFSLVVEVEELKLMTSFEFSSSFTIYYFYFRFKIHVDWSIPLKLDVLINIARINDLISFLSYPFLFLADVVCKEVFAVARGLSEPSYDFKVYIELYR